MINRNQFKFNQIPLGFSIFVQYKQQRNGRFSSSLISKKCFLLFRYFNMWITDNTYKCFNHHLKTFLSFFIMVWIKIWDEMKKKLQIIFICTFEQTNVYSCPHYVLFYNQPCMKLIYSFIFIELHHSQSVIALSD